MNPFSNTTNEASATSTNPSNIASRFGSGAEQDRYGSHFGIGSDGMNRIKQAANYKGVGAEQDRYQSHFSLDQEQVKAAAQSLLHAKGTGAEQDRHASHFGLGNDGWERAKELAKSQGVGAEQVTQLLTSTTRTASNILLGSIWIPLRLRQGNS